VTEQKPFIRVRDKATKHQYDIRRESFNEVKHELVKRVPDSSHPRRPKHFVSLARKKTSTTEVVEGISPSGE
jgi:hypothetical protein